MKSKLPPSEPTASEHPAHQPDRVRPLVRAIKGHLEALQGREITYEDLAGYVGQAASSVFDKFQRTQQPQIEALLGWIERLPESTRNQLINSACRCYPTLDHPRLNHDPVQVSRLKTLLRQANGLAVVQGGNDGLRTFLITALGHSCGRLEPERRQVCGIDVHEPDWFVPVDGVVYLNNLLDPTRLREFINLAWPGIAEMKSRLTILNGIWAGVQNLEAEISLLAPRRNVIFADEFRFKLEDLSRLGVAPIHILTIAEDMQSRVRVAFQQI